MSVTSVGSPIIPRTLSREECEVRKLASTNAVLGALLVRRASGAATVVGSRCRGLLVGACEWQSLQVRACRPSRRPTCQSLTTYSKHANPDQTRRRGGDG